MGQKRFFDEAAYDNKKILSWIASTNPNHPVSLPKMPFLAFSSAFHFPMCIMMLFDTIGANLVCP